MSRFFKIIVNIVDILSANLFLEMSDSLSDARKMRVCVQRKFTSIAGRLFFAERFVSHTKAGKRSEMTWLKREYPLDIVDRQLKLAQGVKHGRSLVPAFGEIRLMLDEQIELVEREIVSPGTHGRDTAAHQFVGNAVIRIKPNGQYFRRDRARDVVDFDLF